MLGMRDGGDVIGAVAMSLRFGAEVCSKNYATRTRWWGVLGGLDRPAARAMTAGGVYARGAMVVWMCCLPT